MSLIHKLIKMLGDFALWVRAFFSVAHLTRFSFWVSVIGSVALFATSESMEVLRVIVEDRQHPVRGEVLFATAALFFGLMSWYCARVLVYLIEPQLLKDAEKDGDKKSARWSWQGLRHAFANPQRLAAFWIPRLCGVIPFVGIAYSLYHAANPQGHPDPNGATHDGLMFLFYLTLLSGLLFLLALYYRRWIAGYLSKRFPNIWPRPIKTAGQVGIGDLPRITLAVVILALLFSLFLFAIFYTTTGQVRFAGWIGPAPLLLFTGGVWIVLGSAAIYFGKRIRLPIITPLLILALILSYFDCNDNHKIRDYSDNRQKQGAPPLHRQPQNFKEEFNKWLAGRKDKDEFKGRPYPVFIVTAEGGGITTAYYTALVLGAIQDRNPAFAQHVFVISSVSGGSVGTAVYAGLNAKCQPQQLDKIPATNMRAAAGPWQTSADRILKDDYLSPLLAAMLYPDLVQRFLPHPFNSWDRARALEERLERSWTTGASCTGELKDVTGSDELSQPYYDFWHDFQGGAVPAIYFNTTNVERGERMVITRLGSNDRLFDNFETLAQINDTADPPFSTAACLSARFPVITPAGFIWDKQRKKFRYVDGGYYENSGTDTANDILAALDYNHTQYNPLIMPVVIRIGFPLPAPRNASQEEEEPTNLQASEQRTKYRGQGLNEILSPVRTLLNTRGARGADSVRQIRNTIDDLSQPGATASRETLSADKNDEDYCTQAGCYVAFKLETEKVALPLGWLLSDISRCNMQQQLGSLIPHQCEQENLWTTAHNQEKIKKVLGMLTNTR